MYTSLIILLMVACTFCQNEFRASFTMTSTAMGTGQVSGIYLYSWSTAAVQIQFTNQKYNETTLYHLTLHDATGATAFNTGEKCGCTIGSVTSSQPVFLASDTKWTKATTVDSTGCFKYNRVVSGTDPAYSVWFNSAGVVCQAYFSDTGRTFVFSNVVSATFTRARDFPTPPGCICKTPLDIVLVMDRSGSVDINEWVSEKKFAIDFALSFEYPTSSADSALKTNLGVVQFNTNAWTSLVLATGSSLNNVNSSLQSMGCCRTGSQSCCNGFTSISSGIRVGTDVLKDSTRTTSNKAIVLLTDGFHNTIFKTQAQCYSCSGIADATQEMLTCITNRGNAAGRKSCLDDLQSAADYAYSSIPGVKIFTVAVGSIFSKPLEEFNILTKYNTAAQFNSADFSTLSTVLNSLTQTVCGSTKPACDGCCGFCACGVCNAPDSCITPACTVSTLQGSCCKQEPYVCPNTDRCKVVNCVANGAASVCQSSPYPCPASTDCYSYSCVNGQCIQNNLVIPKTPCKTAVCENNKVVEKDLCVPGNDLCVDYGCDNGKCTAVPKKFANCFECDPLTGQPKAKICQQQNCSNASCNPLTGNCEYVPISCNDPTDKCDTSYCEPKTGSCVTTNTGSLCVNSTNKCNYTTGCDKTTGLCVYKDVTCPLSTDCQDNVCQQDTGECKLVNTSRCNEICRTQDCTKVSDECVTRVCDPGETNPNCNITTYKNQTCINALNGDTCKRYVACNASTGCVYKVETCSTLPPPNSCQYYVADSTYDGCCKLLDKVCGYDKCVKYKCNATDGKCSSTPVCPPSNACFKHTCNSADGSCSTTQTVCTPPNACTLFTRCDNVTGCIFSQKDCDDKKSCTRDSCDTKTGKCVNADITCNDNNACTDDKCEGGKCSFTPKSCNDKNACTADTCDKAKGCVYTNRNATTYCDDSNACTIDTCEPAKGCVYKNITCNDNKKCTLDKCDRNYGCLYNPVVCNATIVCALASCNNQTGNCSLTPLICGSNLELIVATSVSGGILAAIICAAIIGAALFGGGSVALYNQVSNASNTMTVANNPLYSAPAPGNNPLYNPA